MPTALVTGASRGLGRALAEGLAENGWDLIIVARGADIDDVASRLSSTTAVTAVRGNVAHSSTRRLLAEAAARANGLELVVNNAGTLGPSPLPRLVDVDPDDLLETLEINVVAQLAVVQAVAPFMNADGAVVNVTSDASVEAMEGWGTYGAGKAALDHLSAVLATENPGWSVYAFDPGDMRTQMHQDAFPGEDIDDRPEAATVVPALFALLASRPPSGRYRASDLLSPTP